MPTSSRSSSDCSPRRRRSRHLPRVAPLARDGLSRAGAAEPFSRLTEAIVERWPDYPPYEGIHETVIPHLTVAYGDDALLAEVEADVTPKLPIEAHVAEAVLLEELELDVRWAERDRFPLRVRTALRTSHLPGTPLSSWSSSLGELDSRARNEIPHRGRHQHLARRRQGSYARADVHGDPADTLFQKLDLAGVDPVADLEPFLRSRDHDCLRATDCARAGPSNVPLQKPSPARSTSRPRYSSMWRRTRAVMPLELLPPALLSELRGALRGVDDVGEEHSEQDAVRLPGPTTHYTVTNLPYFGDDAVYIADPRQGRRGPGEATSSFASGIFSAM